MVALNRQRKRLEQGPPPRAHSYAWCDHSSEKRVQRKGNGRNDEMMNSWWDFVLSIKFAQAPSMICGVDDD